jgi:integrase
MVSFDAQTAVDQVNQRLKALNIKVEVLLKGKTLRLRATLPNKNGVGRSQQPICLGISASPDGIAEMERQAKEVHRQKVEGIFNWDSWQRSPKVEVLPASQAIEHFKAHYFKHNEIKETTWRDYWVPTFKPLLQQNGAITANLLLTLVLATDENTDRRKRTCQKAQNLADFLKIDIDLKQYAGNYGHGSLKPRDLPPDKLVLEWRDRIPNASWQWVYGMIAAFGLRPHEVFACEFVNAYTVRVFEEIPDVGETKTGERIVRAVMPEWAVQWDLLKIKLPPVTASKPGDFGDRNSTQFSRYEIPFPAYNLRHAYAIRGSVVCKMSLPVMAAMMGHSEEVHLKTYHHWLSEDTNETEYQRAMLNRSKL